MSSTNILGDKDVNASLDQQQQQQQQQFAKEVRSMDYHRQVFHSKMAEETYVPSSRTVWRKANILYSAKQYVSPSDNIMSPCSAKINALRNKHASKYVLPRSH